MESTQNLKKRIRSVANINKITKAMELVAATKMRKAQEVALASRPYAFVALDLLANLTLLETELPELLKKRKVSKTLLVLVASDKGLAGAFNSSLFRKFEKYISQNKNQFYGSDHRTEVENSFFVAVGEKSAAYLARKGPNPAKRQDGPRPEGFRGHNALRKFTNVGDFTTPEQVQPLADFLVDGYLKKDWDKVIVFSTHFKSALKQEPLMREILPISFNSIKETIKEIVPETGKFAELIKEQGISFTDGIGKNPPLPVRQRANGVGAQYLIEPSPKIVLENLAKHLFFMQVYHLILEANASEHSARRMAMKTASDNASELGETLNLQYNKSRQSAITKEVIEITAGSESLN